MVPCAAGFKCCCAVFSRQVYPTHLATFSMDDEMKKCTYGQFFDFVGGGCNDCPAGKHQPFDGQKGCYDCLHDKVSAVRAKDCHAGTPSGWDCVAPTCAKAAPPKDIDDW
jgi:hypothetical protein